MSGLNGPSLNDCLELLPVYPQVTFSSHLAEGSITTGTSRIDGVPLPHLSFSPCPSLPLCYAPSHHIRMLFHTTLLCGMADSEEHSCQGAFKKGKMFLLYSAIHNSTFAIFHWLKSIIQIPKGHSQENELRFLVGGTAKVRYEDCLSHVQRQTFR